MDGRLIGVWSRGASGDTSGGMSRPGRSWNNATPAMQSVCHGQAMLSVDPIAQTTIASMHPCGRLSPGPFRTPAAWGIEKSTRKGNDPRHQTRHHASVAGEACRIDSIIANPCLRGELGGAEDWTTPPLRVPSPRACSCRHVTSSQLPWNLLMPGARAMQADPAGSGSLSALPLLSPRRVILGRLGVLCGCRA